jgi:hypothetical protein
MTTLIGLVKSGETHSFTASKRVVVQRLIVRNGQLLGWEKIRVASLSAVFETTAARFDRGGIPVDKHARFEIDSGHDYIAAVCEEPSACEGEQA